MASRTKQKEEARARRLAEERERAERERRQRRTRMVAGVVVGAIAVIAVAIALSAGGGGNVANKPGSAGTKRVDSQVSSLLAGIPQSGPVLGNPSAPVTMDYYGDLECPVCRDFTLAGGFPQLVKNDVRSGKVKVVYRAFQTATPDPGVFSTQQMAALAAGRQNRFWNFVELFYNEQGAESTGYVTPSYLTNLAQQIPGLNLSAWNTARKDQVLASQVAADETSGTTQGVSGTPTLIFQGPKGKGAPTTGVPSYSDLQKVIKQVS